MEIVEENDIISKLLMKEEDLNEVNIEKSLHDELQEIGELFDINHPSKLSTVTDISHPSKVSTSDINHPSKVSTSQNSVRLHSFDLNKLIDEFQTLSYVMDDEIAARDVSEDQKKATKQQTPPVQSVQQPTQSAEEYEHKIKSLQDALQCQKNVNFELQNEFNKVLNEKEEEIEKLQTENYQLKVELRENEQATNEIAMENEELEDKVVIKDEYIASLRLQMTRLEQQHEQDVWKLSQADDLLEMVENKSYADEMKYKGVISKLANKLHKQTIQRGKQARSVVNQNKTVRPPPVVNQNKTVRPPPGFESNTCNNTETRDLIQPITVVDLASSQYADEILRNESGFAKTQLITDTIADPLNEKQELKHGKPSAIMLPSQQKQQQLKQEPSCKLDDQVLRSLGWNNIIKHKRVE